MSHIRPFFVRIVEMTPTSLPQEGETDTAMEGTETKEMANVMSPSHSTSASASSGDREHVLDTAGLEIIASVMEEICTFLKQAKNLMVSGGFLVIYSLITVLSNMNE